MSTRISEELRAFKTNQLNTITRARSPMQLEYFVVGRHEDRLKQWHQLLIEADEKYKAIVNAEAEKRLAELEIEELEFGRLTEVFSRRDEIANERIAIKVQQKRNNLETLEVAMQGALKELLDLHTMAKMHFSDLWGMSEEQLLAEEKTYWKKRLARQISIDVLTAGRIGAGNLDCILQLPKELRKEILAEAVLKSEEFQRLDFLVQDEHRQSLGLPTIAESLRAKAQLEQLAASHKGTEN